MPMNARARIAIEEGVITVVLFTAAVCLHYLVPIWGLGGLFSEGPFKDYATGPAILVATFIWGPALGCLLAVVNFLSDSPALRRRPLGLIVLMKSGLYLLCFMLSGMLVHYGLLAFAMGEHEMNAIMSTSVVPQYGIALQLSIVADIVLINFLLEVRRKVGPGNLYALLTGRYQRPRIENRIFLFLDLERSTATAEKLGHERYSEFIRASFQDLTEVVLRYEAEVYQFVGDQVILTWRSDSAAAADKCLRAFFAFERRLMHRYGWYYDRFGMVPAFRGGVAMGPVTATEVGDIKREIAFHGDVLNTSARLLELSKQHHQNLLVAGPVWEAVANGSDFLPRWFGEITLRGKSDKISVYGIEPSVTLAATYFA